MLHILTGGTWNPHDLRPMSAIAVLTLLWTVPGSALLALCFAWTRGRGFSLEGRLALTVLLGAVAGAAIMVPAGTSTAILLGLAYGLATGVAWAALHMMLYGRDKGDRAGSRPA